MMTIQQFIAVNNIRPADAIIMNKKFFGMLDHYVIYMGIHRNQHRFIANYTDGVKVIPNHEFNQFLRVLQPSSVDRFPGPDHLRRNAVQRALSRVGEKAYDLFANNCEHFKNWVHHGIENSLQVENFGTSMTIGGLTLAAIGAHEKNKTMTWIGIGATLLGAIAYAIEKNQDNNNQ
jgi:hypothetical protein